MKRNNWTQDDIVERARHGGYVLARTTVSRVMNGRVIPSLPTLQALAYALAMPELLTGEQEAQALPMISGQVAHVTRFVVRDRQLKRTTAPRFAVDVTNDTHAASRTLGAIDVVTAKGPLGPGDIIVLELASKKTVDWHGRYVAAIDPIEDNQLRIGHATRTRAGYEITTLNDELLVIHDDAVLGDVYGIWHRPQPTPEKARVKPVRATVAA